MARPVVLSVEDKFRLVIAVISGELTVAEAARRSKVSEQSVGNLKRQFEDEVEELKAALGEAHVELRVWKKSAEYRLGPTNTRNGLIRSTRSKAPDFLTFACCQPGTYTRTCGHPAPGMLELPVASTIAVQGHDERSA